MHPRESINDLSEKGRFVPIALCQAVPYLQLFKYDLICTDKVQKLNTKRRLQELTT